ncbi:MAG: hypothetical protein ONB48_08140 [candidate division KSB1 bacterium]|nr:hypothetical protein [candidate division KSB1 bacterium]MDZ7285617.1 hypothetical protein [candidate division KSB1 bacterium]MDZ7298649.1 hypothetical protein [candidate division KSB1 bacterium]MDZ7307489.1 hypothetical protein [candidate division KSB1 bacterium]MDZ7349514.1 hypothetical protein [candidate division KSB1 bacterium]
MPLSKTASVQLNQKQRGASICDHMAFLLQGLSNRKREANFPQAEWTARRINSRDLGFAFRMFTARFGHRLAPASNSTEHSGAFNIASGLKHAGMKIFGF